FGTDSTGAVCGALCNDSRPVVISSPKPITIMIAMAASSPTAIGSRFARNIVLSPGLQLATGAPSSGCRYEATRFSAKALQLPCTLALWGVGNGRAKSFIRANAIKEARDTMPESQTLNALSQDIARNAGDVAPAAVRIHLERSTLSGFLLDKDLIVTPS